MILSYKIENASYRVIFLSSRLSLQFRAYCNINFLLRNTMIPDYDFLCLANKILILRTADASRAEIQRYVLSYVAAGYFISSCALYENVRFPFVARDLHPKRNVI